MLWEHGHAGSIPATRTNMSLNSFLNSATLIVMQEVSPHEPSDLVGDLTVISTLLFSEARFTDKYDG